MEGLKNILIWFNNNWSLFLLCAGLCVILRQRFRYWQSLSAEEKAAFARKRLQETILKYIADAEFEYSDFSKSGSLKRSEVISKIYEDYPIFSKLADQNDLLSWIDQLIDAALPTLREVVIHSNEDSERKEPIHL